MPAPYSEDLRRRLINAYYNKEGSQRQLAKRFEVSLTFVRNLLQHYQQTGTIEPKKHGGGKVGERVVMDCPRNKGKNTSILGALSLDGLIASMTVIGSTNKKVFEPTWKKSYYLNCGKGRSY